MHGSYPGVHSSAVVGAGIGGAGVRRGEALGAAVVDGVGGGTGAVVVGAREAEWVGGPAVFVILRVTVVGGGAVVVSRGFGKALIWEAVTTVDRVADWGDPALSAIAIAPAGATIATAVAITAVRIGCTRTHCRA